MNRRHANDGAAAGSSRPGGPITALAGAVRHRCDWPQHVVSPGGQRCDAFFARKTRQTLVPRLRPHRSTQILVLRAGV